jgi:nucleoside triphosphate pyrophosphatase
MIERPPLILASASLSRASMLRNAGIDIAVQPSEFDEEPIKTQGLTERWPVDDVALKLATGKAVSVSKQNSEALVIGADQMLDCDGRWFDKVATVEAAREQLLVLRGRKHRLISAVCVAKSGEPLWTCVDTADLTMRPFSNAFLTWYLSDSGRTAIGTVGGYRLEGSGSQLFSDLRGDYFTILGLPLLPLLDFLRQTGAILK